MPRNLAQLMDVIEQALNGMPDPRVAAQDTINEAGRHLCTMHTWAFLERPAALLDFVADQAYVALPSDFIDLIGVESSDTLNNSVTVVSQSSLQVLRAGINQTSLDFYVALEYASQASASVPPGRARLGIWPTPASSTTGALRLTYRSGWVELVDNGSYANIPADAETLLLEIARALAQGRSLGGAFPVERLSAIAQSSTFQLLSQRYGGAQWRVGQLEGGIVSHEPTGTYRPFTSITF